MKILIAAAEAAPFAKNGGLGDVIGSLPQELHRQGADVRVMMPNYSSINAAYRRQMVFKGHFIVSVGWRRQYCGIFAYMLNDVTFYFVDNEYYFARPELYGYYDDAERFAFFARAILEAMAVVDFFPDVLQLNDWHTAMTAVLLRTQYHRRAAYRQVRTVQTIHNLAYQGIFPHSILGELFGLDDRVFTPDKLEFYGNVNCLKGGLVYADKLSTVSRSYAREICTPYFGEGLDGLLTARQHDLCGIVNGIDYERYNPADSQGDLFAAYDSHTIVRRSKNKAYLQHQLGLPVESDKLMVAVVSRLVEPKGIDLIAAVAAELLQEPLQLIVLGNGEARYEEFFRRLQADYPWQVSAQLRFDEQQAQAIYAGTDLFLMPSRFEPCGVGQLIAMRYGAVPLVRETGGLRDTVQPYDEAAGTGCGFTFCNYNAHELLAAVRQAVRVFACHDKWQALARQAMERDFSWTCSAAEYMELYKKLLEA